MEEEALPHYKPEYYYPVNIGDIYSTRPDTRLRAKLAMGLIEPVGYAGIFSLCFH